MGIKLSSEIGEKIITQHMMMDVIMLSSTLHLIVITMKASEILTMML